MEHVKVGKALRLKRAKRVVQTMIDQLLAAESNLLGLTNLRCHDEYTYNHSVNVGILSIAIGQRVGLGKNRLVELGMAAIFHDIGKSCIPLAILNKPAAFDEREWAVDPPPPGPRGRGAAEAQGGGRPDRPDHAGRVRAPPAPGRHGVPARGATRAASASAAGSSRSPTATTR